MISLVFTFKTQITDLAEDQLCPRLNLHSHVQSYGVYSARSHNPVRAMLCPLLAG